MIRPVDGETINVVLFTNIKLGYHMDVMVCQPATLVSVNLGATIFVYGAMTVGIVAGLCSAQSFVSHDGTNLYALSPGVTNE